MKKIITVLSFILLSVLLVSCKDEEIKDVFYDVVFNTTTTDKIASQRVKEGEFAVKPPVNPTKDNYTFEFWVLEGETVEWAFTTRKVEANITLVATYKENEVPPILETVTITFDLNGGTGSITNQEIDKGTKAILPNAPEKTDYEFTGWYLEGKIYDFDTTVNKNIVLVAGWKADAVIDPEPDKLVVTFDLNYDKAPNYPSQTVEYGEGIDIKENPVRSGYTFLGWFTSEGNKFNINTPIVESIRLEARWEENDKLPEDAVERLLHNFSFEENEGFKASNVYDGFYYGGITPYTWEVFYGSVSRGSNTVNPLEGLQSVQIRHYENSGNEAFLQTQFNVSHLTKIVFSANTNNEGTKLKVLYSTEEGEFNTGVINHGGVYALKNEKTVYESPVPNHFKGQKLFVRFEIVGSDELEDKTNVQIDEVKLYAMASPLKSINVNLYDEELNLIEEVSVKNGEKLGLLSAPSKLGYKFVGWYTEKEYTNLYDFSKAVVEEFSLYAKYEEDNDVFVGDFELTGRYGIVPKTGLTEEGKFTVEFKFVVLGKEILLNSTNFKSGSVIVNGNKRDLVFVEEGTTVWANVLLEDEAYYEFVENDDTRYQGVLNINDYVSTYNFERTNKEISQLVLEDETYYMEYLIKDNNKKEVSLTETGVKEAYQINTTNLDGWKKSNLFGTESNYLQMAKGETGLRHMFIVRNDDTFGLATLNHTKHYEVKFINGSDEKITFVKNGEKAVRPTLEIPSGKVASFKLENNEEFDFNKTVTSDLVVTISFVEGNLKEYAKINFNDYAESNTSPDSSMLNEALATDIFKSSRNVYIEIGNNVELRLGSSKNAGVVTFGFSEEITKISVKVKAYKQDFGRLVVNGVTKEVGSEYVTLEFDVNSKEVTLENLHKIQGEDNKLVNTRVTIAEISFLN